ncbi:FecR family protein [Marinilabilia salmonicolor]|uniref:FecR family protein n=1 Tax=Marinilabilia salmonicolor TaxID=989 RepID=UPI00029A5E1B|nr:FecR domain-containing protein [Marinilabilia salmonicolor]
MKDILREYIKGECTSTEFKQAVKVLVGFSKQGELNDFMHRHWKGLKADIHVGEQERFSNVLDRIHHRINMEEFRPNLRRRLYVGFAKVAAILIVPLLVVSGLYLSQQVSDETVAMTRMSTPAGLQSVVELPDGSKVWLNSESEIYFPSTFKGQKERKIELIGEGYFEVESDKKRPFIVSAGNEMNVRVTGTSFNLSAYGNEPDISVALVEGGVTIERDNNDFLSRIEPGDVANFDKSTQKLSVVRGKDMEPHLAWKEGRFVFVNESFEFVLRTMERKYNVKYKIVDPCLLEYRITATFVDETLDEFLRIITISSPIEYEIKRHQNVEGEKNVFDKREVILTRR